MKMVPTPCINIVLWAWLDEWLSVAWGPVKGVLLEQIVVWFDVGISVMSRERKENFCDKSGARFSMQSRCGGRGGRERAVVRTNVTGYVGCSHI
jgi:hypothetical protein